MFDRLLKIMKDAMPDVDVSGAKPESRLLEDLGFDSLGLMMLSMSLEDEFGIHFDKPENFETVQDVMNYLEKNAKK